MSMDTCVTCSGEYTDENPKCTKCENADHHAACCHSEGEGTPEV